MIRKRKRPINEYLEPFAFTRLIQNNHPDLDRDQLQTLICIWYVNRSTNRGASHSEIVALTGFPTKRIENINTSLHSLGYTQRAGKTHNLLTVSGEYLIKGLEIKLGRLIEQYRALKWHNPKNVDPRLMFLAAKKGTKFY